MIGYYVHHLGNGHLNRARSIAAHCALPMTGLSTLPAPDDWPGPWVRLPRDDDGDPATFGDVTAGGRLHWARVRHGGLRGRMALIAQWIEAASPGSWCRTSRLRWPCLHGSWERPPPGWPCAASAPTHRTGPLTTSPTLSSRPGQQRCPSPAGRRAGGPRRSIPARSLASTAARAPRPPRTSRGGGARGGCCC